MKTAEKSNGVRSSGMEPGFAAACCGLLLAAILSLSSCQGATVYFSENFDSALALPTGWTSSSDPSVGDWDITAFASDTAPRSAHIADTSGYGYSMLTSPSLHISVPLATLSFRHSYNTGSSYDWCSLEISVAGGAFTDFVSAGGFFLTNGYDPDNYPAGWSRSSGGFITTEAYLPAGATGKDIRLRWRFYSDSSATGPGWFVDTISVTDGQPLLPDDISVDLVAAPDPVAIGGSLTYQITVTNTGPSAATAVVVTNVLPASVALVSCTPSVGSCTNLAGTLVANIGTLLGESSATLIVVVQPTIVGMLTNRAWVSRAEPDAELPNNAVTNVTTSATPALFVNSVTVNEGDAGSVDAGCYAYLSPPSAQTVTVHYATSPGTADAGIDFSNVSGVLSFAPGETFREINIPVFGDLLHETNETFFLYLSDPSNAVVAVSRGTAIIVDNDPAPGLLVLDTSVTEGDNGLTNAVFTALLTAPSALPVTLNYYAYDGTALSPGDYWSTNGTVVFPPGSVSQTFAVPVVGDRILESGEYFRVGLSAINADTIYSLAYGLIIDDDGVPGKLDHFSWGAVANPAPLGRPTTLTITAQDYLGNTVSNFTGSVGISATGLVSELEGTLLPSPSPQYTYSGSETVGYSFTPSTSLVVTHVRHYFGTKVSIWTDDGVLLASQDINDVPGTWHETRLSHPVQLWAGKRYRVGAYSGGGYYYGTNSYLSDFSYGTIDGQYSSYGDEFPQGYSSYTWLVGLRYWVGRLKPVDVAPSETGLFEAGVWSGDVTLLEAVPNTVLSANDGEGHQGFSAPFNVSVIDDISLAVMDSPDPVAVDGRLTYRVVVTNTGPDAATGVTVTNFLPDSVSLLSAVASQGTCNTNGAAIICSLGTMAGGSDATLEITTSPFLTGTLTNVAVVSRDGSDFTLSNNVARALTTVATPTVTIDDAGVVEGDSGFQAADFVIHLSPPTEQIVTARYATSTGTAKTTDFVSTNGVVAFTPGETEQNITVWVRNDLFNEDDETFAVNLSDLTNAVLARNQAIGTITNNDPLPFLYLYGSLVNEGDIGTTNVSFTVLLAPASGRTVIANYYTSGGTANPSSDYQPTNGAVIFPPGVTVQTITVPVFGDTVPEDTESIGMQLTSISNAYFNYSSVVALIVNDDGLPGQLHHFSWAPISSPQVLGMPRSVSVFARDYYGEIVSNFSGSISLSAFALSGLTNDTILNSSTQSDFTSTYYTEGYVFTPNTDLLVTHVRHFSGTVVSIWTDDGELIATQAVSGASGTWNETALPMPVQLFAGTRYRVGVFSSAGYVYLRNEGPGRFLYGTIDTGCYSYGDAFPLYTTSGRWPLVDLRYSVPTLQSLIISPTESGVFSGGIWTGEISVLEPGAQVFLLADDGAGHSGKSALFEAGIQLGILREGDNIILHWPATATGCVLESAHGLAAPMQWVSNSQPTAVVGDQVMVTNPLSSDQKVFRLKWP